MVSTWKRLRPFARGSTTTPREADKWESAAGPLCSNTKTWCRPSEALVDHQLGDGAGHGLGEVEPVDLEDALPEPLGDRLGRAAQALEGPLRVVRFHIDDRHRPLRRLLVPDGLAGDAQFPTPLRVVLPARPDGFAH